MTLGRAGVCDAPDEGEELIAIEWFAQVAVRTRATLELIGRHLVVRRDEHDCHRGTRCEQAVVQVEAGHASQMDVEHEARGLTIERRAEVLVSAGVRLDSDARGPQHAGERGAHGWVVVDDGDPSVLLGRCALDGLHEAMT